MIQVTIVFDTKYKWNTFRDSWIFRNLILPITKINEFICIDIREVE